MKHWHARIAVTAVAALGLAMGVTIIGAGSAHADNTEWNCASLSPVSTTSEVDGFDCGGYGGSLGGLSQNGTLEYICTSFHRTQEWSPSLGNYWDVTANGCAVLQ